ncbi:Tetratricopeptide repeat superfamily protein, partial [Perilla frutescens var. frutescens]
MIRIYGKLGLYDDAQKTFLEIRRSGKLSDEKTYTTMAQVHLNFGNFEKALEVMKQMEISNIPCSRFSYITLLQCYVAKGDLSSAESAYQDLSKTGLPDAMSCKDMLNLYLRLGLSEKANSFVAQIRKDKIEFDEELLMTVVRVYCRGGMLKEVEQLIEELSKSETFESPFIQTFSMALSGQFNNATKSENWSGALDRSRAVAIEL